MKNLLCICKTVIILAMINITVLPSSVSGQDTTSDTSEYMTVHMLQGLCWYTITNEAGYVIAEINDVFGIDKITTLTCKLTIQAPAKNQGVLLQFTGFNVTDSEDCHDDTLIIFDGPDTSSPELSPVNGLCGDTNPGNYMSSGDTLTLMLLTDQLGNGYDENEYSSMFFATWTAFTGLEDDTPVSSSYESVEPIGADELFCCESGDVCINIMFACDGVKNCVDASDEGPSACTTDYGLFGTLEILAIVLVALALVTAFLAFIAFVTCFCRSLWRDDKSLMESTEYEYENLGRSDTTSSQGSTDHLMVDNSPRGITLPPSSFTGIPRPVVDPNEAFNMNMFDTTETLASIASRRLRRQADIEDANRNVVYNPNAALDEDAARSMMMSNFTWQLPRAQVDDSEQQSGMVRSRSMNSIVSVGQWENFWLRRAPENVEIIEAERIPFGLDPYEVISEADTSYMNEALTSDEQSIGRVLQRPFVRNSSHRRSRSLSPSGRAPPHEGSAAPRDLLSPDEEWHMGRSRSDYAQLTRNVNRTQDMPRFFLSGINPSVPGSEV